MKTGLFICLSASCLWNLCYADSKAEAVFECTFEKDVCGLFNDKDMVARWERKQMAVGGRSETVMTITTDGRKKQTARLLTPYFEEHWRDVQGCLSFDLFTSGDGVTSFRVRQQDDSGILQILGVHTQMSKWRKISLTIDVEEYIQFMFEGHVNPSLGGTVVAFDNIVFRTGDCDS